MEKGVCREPRQVGFFIKDLLRSPIKKSDVRFEHMTSPSSTLRHTNQCATESSPKKQLDRCPSIVTVNLKSGNNIGHEIPSRHGHSSLESAKGSSISESGNDVTRTTEGSEPTSSADRSKKIAVPAQISELARVSCLPASVVRVPVVRPLFQKLHNPFRVLPAHQRALGCPCTTSDCPSTWDKFSHDTRTFKGLYSGDELFEIKDSLPVPVPLPFYVRMRDSASCDGCMKAKRCRRSRTVFTELQLMGLEKRFETQKYLSTPDRMDLADKLGLSQIQVKTWYQNRRMKWKKQVLQNGGTEPPTKPKGRPRKIASASGLESGVRSGHDDVTK